MERKIIEARLMDFNHRAVTFYATDTYPKHGQKVQITELNPEGTKGMLVAEKHLAVRKPNHIGVVWSIVAGHGGDAWAVQHDNGDIGVYSVDEMMPLS